MAQEEDNKATPSAPPSWVLVVFDLVRISYVFGACPGPCWTSTGPAVIFILDLGDLFVGPHKILREEGGEKQSQEENQWWENQGRSTVPKKNVEKPQDGRQKSCQNIGNPYQMEDNKDPKGAVQSAAPVWRRRRRRLVVFYLVRISDVLA